MRTRMTFKQRLHRFNITPVTIIVSLVLLFYCIVLIFPYIYAFFASINSISSFDKTRFLAIPLSFKNIDFKNYAKAFDSLTTEGGATLFDMFLNSMWYSFGTTTIGLFFATCCAYVCAKYKFPGRRFIYVFALVMMMVPIIGSQSSALAWNKLLHGYDTPLYALINSQTIDGSFIIILALFKAVDWSYAESGFIDGCGHFRTFFQIMLPQIFSALVALFVTDFIARWADADTSLIFFPNLPTLGTGLFYAYNTFAGTVRLPVYFAALIIVMLPSLILFLVFQNKIMDMQLTGGIKG